MRQPAPIGRDVWADEPGGVDLPHAAGAGHCASGIVRMSMSDHHTLPWAQPGWREQASAWIYAELEQRGVTIVGAIEQPHVRPWSTVLRVPTSAGDHYFKATSPLLAHEPALTQWLAQQRPDCIAPVLAVDRERGWMLMPDGGTTLRAIIQAGG